MQNAREAAESCHLFGWDTHQAFELRTQVVLTNPHLIAERPNRQRTMLTGDLSNGTLHQLQALRCFTEATKQQTFQQSKPSLYGWRGKQAFTEIGSEASPDRIQRNDLIIDFGEGKLQERIGSSRLKMDAEKAHTRLPIYTVIGTPYSYPPAIRAGDKRLGLVWLIGIK